MVIGIIGESCAGKSTLARALAEQLGATLVSGKDYLRLARTEAEATALFRQKLSQALTGEHLIYVASEREQAALLPPGALRVLVRAELATIKERFRARLHGNLPAPVERMLEQKHGCFDDGVYTLVFDTQKDALQAMCDAITALL